MADQPNVFWDDIAKTFATGQVGAANSGTAITGGGDQAWQFRPESYGAAGDAKIVGDVSVTSGSAIITSASANWSAADKNKHIMINGAVGITSGPLITTILSVQSTTQVTLAANATATQVTCAAAWGTDDTAAINLAVQAAGAYALANNYFAEVLFKSVYVAAAAPSQTTSPAVFNAQIPLPYPAQNGSSRKLVLALTGPADNGHVQYWESLVPNIVAGGIISIPPSPAPSTPDVTFGQQSVIGGPSGASGFTGGYANMKVVVKGLAVMCGAYTNQYAYDFSIVSAMRVQQSSAQILAAPGVGGGASPLIKDLPANAGFQSTISAGLRSPVTANNADVLADDFSVEGFARSLYVFDHFTGGRVMTMYSDVALKIDLTQGASGQSHGIFIQNLSSEVYNGGISATGGTICPVYINLDSEVVSPAYDLSDSGNVLRGEIHWTDPADNRTPVVTGGGNVKFVNDRIGPGFWASAPAVPASTTSQQNTAWRDAAVTVAGGTVTVITVDGQTMGITSGTVFVPSGKNIAVTYSVAPTWKWVLL